MADPVFELIAYSDIAKWRSDDHVAAMTAFRISAERMAQRPYNTKRLGADSTLLSAIGARALSLSQTDAANGNICRDFFETAFHPHLLRVDGDRTTGRVGFAGFVTGYFEPEIEVARQQSSEFPVPILARPPDLVEFKDADRPPGLPEGFNFAREAEAGFVEYFDRAQIEGGALNDRGLELYWCKSRIELFFVQIQGSARLRLPDGTVERISYDGKTGHPFTAIGRLLVEQGELGAETVSMQSIRGWLEIHPDKAMGLMQKNRSYIFFKKVDHPMPQLGPVAAAGMPLMPGRSLAIDHRLHTFATPVFVETREPLPQQSAPFAALMIAQDTGSAIVGPARGDLFIGSGYEAGMVAGAIKHAARFTVLLPRGHRVNTIA